MKTVGVDLGGTKTMAVLVDGGVVVAKKKLPTPRTGGPNDILATVIRTIEAVDPDGQAGAIGVGAPGPVVPGTGVLPAAPNLPGWDHPVPVADQLSAALGGRPVAVDNDVNVGTLAEWRQGAGQGVDDLLGVFMGTGVGAGLILDGRLRQGPRGLAGEIGHTFVSFRDRDEPHEPKQGELEDYAGRNAMERRARHFIGAGETSILDDLAGGGRMKSKTWSDALAADDPLARRLVDEAASALAAAMASAIALVDVEAIVLGGGMAERLGEVFRHRVEKELMERAFAGSGVEVRPARLGDTGGAVGAALLVEDQV